LDEAQYSMKAELVPENGDPPIPIERDVTVIGRHESCDVVIQSVGISKRHCVVVKTDGLLVIRDLATTNGTKVKGQRVRWAALLPEDRISLGGYKIRVYLGSDDMPSPSEQRRKQVLSSAPPAVLQGAVAKVSGNAATVRMPKEDVGVPAWKSPIAPAPAPATSVQPEFAGGFEIIDDDEDEIIELE
jgi:pSer/pThr/pTyr-binding forkhead associated (FHA) protein